MAQKKRKSVQRSKLSSKSSDSNAKAKKSLRRLRGKTADPSDSPSKRKASKNARTLDNDIRAKPRKVGAKASGKKRPVPPRKRKERLRDTPAKDSKSATKSKSPVRVVSRTPKRKTTKDKSKPLPAKRKSSKSSDRKTTTRGHASRLPPKKRKASAGTKTKEQRLLAEVKKLRSALAKAKAKAKSKLQKLPRHVPTHKTILPAKGRSRQTVSKARAKPRKSTKKPVPVRTSKTTQAVGTKTPRKPTSRKKVPSTDKQPRKRKPRAKKQKGLTAEQIAARDRYLFKKPVRTRVEVRSARDSRVIGESRALARNVYFVDRGSQVGFEEKNELPDVERHMISGNMNRSFRDYAVALSKGIENKLKGTRFTDPEDAPVFRFGILMRSEQYDTAAIVDGIIGRLGVELSKMLPEGYAAHLISEGKNFSVRISLGSYTEPTIYSDALLEMKAQRRLLDDIMDLVKVAGGRAESLTDPYWWAFWEWEEWEGGS